MPVQPIALPMLRSAEAEQARGPEHVFTPPTTAEAKPAGGVFGALLGQAIEGANASVHRADAAADALAAGRADDLHGTMIAVKEADINLKLVGAIRNKLLDAFHELWRTNV